MSFQSTRIGTTAPSDASTSTTLRYIAPSMPVSDLISNPVAHLPLLAASRARHLGGLLSRAIPEGGLNHLLIWKPYDLLFSGIMTLGFSSSLLTLSLLGNPSSDSNLDTSRPGQYD